MKPDMWRLDADGFYQPAIPPAPVPVKVPKPPRTCGDSHCSLPATEGRFCAEHAERLARVREEFAAEGQSLHATGGASRFRRNRKKRPPTCCAPGCDEPRIPPAPFCVDHEHMETDE